MPNVMEVSPFFCTKVSSRRMWTLKMMLVPAAFAFAAHVTTSWWLVDVITAVNMSFRNHIPIQMELQMMGKQKVSARLKCLVLILPAAASIAYVAG